MIDKVRPINLWNEKRKIKQFYCLKANRLTSQMNWICVNCVITLNYVQWTSVSNYCCLKVVFLFYSFLGLTVNNANLYLMCTLIFWVVQNFVIKLPSRRLSIMCFKCLLNKYIFRVELICPPTTQWDTTHHLNFSTGETKLCSENCKKKI